MKKEIFTGNSLAYTKFAEFLRVLRVKNHENMGDTAKLLGVKVAFVSAVETGKKKYPELRLVT